MITEGGFSYPPRKEHRGLENPRSVKEEKHRDYYETTSNSNPIIHHIASFELIAKVVNTKKRCSRNNGFLYFAISSLE